MNAARPRIGIDLDDVLNDLGVAWIAKYNELYNDNMTIHDIKTWAINDYVKCGDKIFDILKYTKNLCYHLNVKPDAPKVVEWLQKYADVYIVTATYPENIMDKVMWLAEYFPTIDISNLIICHNKSLIDLDYLIDDSPKNLIGFKGQYIMFTQPWNTYMDNTDKDKYIRVNNWSEIAVYFKSWNVLGKSIFESKLDKQ